MVYLDNLLDKLNDSVNKLLSILLIITLLVPLSVASMMGPNNDTSLTEAVGEGGSNGTSEGAVQLANSGMYCWSGGFKVSLVYDKDLKWDPKNKTKDDYVKFIHKNGVIMDSENYIFILPSKANNPNGSTGVANWPSSSKMKVGKYNPSTKKLEFYSASTSKNKLVYLGGNYRYDENPYPDGVLYLKIMNRLKSDPDKFKRSGWKTLLDEAREDKYVTRSKKVWEYITGPTSSGSYNISGRLNKAFYEDSCPAYGKTAWWNDEEKSRMNLARSLDCLYSLYGLQKTTAGRNAYKAAIEALLNGQLSENPFAISIIPAYSMYTANEFVHISGIDFLNAYFGLNSYHTIGDYSSSNDIKKNHSKRLSDLRAQLKYLVERDIETNPNTTRSSSKPIADKNDALSWAASAITSGRLNTLNGKFSAASHFNTNRYLELLYFNSVDGKPSNTSGTTPMESGWLFGQNMYIFYDAPQLTASFGKIVAEPDDYVVSPQNKVLGKDVDLKIYPNIKTEANKATWNTILKQYSENTFTLKLKVTRKCDYTDWDGLPVNYVDPTYQTGEVNKSFSAAQLKEMINGDIAVSENVDLTSSYPVDMQAGELNVKFTYTMDLTLSTKDGDKTVSWKTENTKDKSDTASFILPAEEPDRIRYTSTPKAYAELKNYGKGSNLSGTINEDYEVMAGVPTTEQLYYAVGGSEFIVDISVEKEENKKAVRSYISYIAGTPCQFKVGDQAKQYTVPSYSGKLLTGSDYNINVHEGDVTVSATISGTIKNDASPVTALHSATCPAQPNAGDLADRAAAYASLTEWYNKVLAFQIEHTSTSEPSAGLNGLRKTTIGGVKESSTLPPCPTSVPATTSARAGCSYRPPSKNSPGSPCSNEMATANPGAAVNWSVTATITIKQHCICGPCCSHDLPDVYDTWSQSWQYDSTRITDVHLWTIDQGAVSNLSDIIGPAVDAEATLTNKTVTSGDGTTHNVFGAYTNANNYGDGIVGAKIRQGAPTMFYNIAMKNSNTLTGHNTTTTYFTTDGIGGATESSLVGRVRYNLAGTWKDAEQHDVVYYDLGTRTNKCDGLAKTYDTNIRAAGGKGHGEKWAPGFIYNKLKGEATTKGVSTNSHISSSKLQKTATQNGGESINKWKTAVWNQCGQTDFPLNDIGYLQEHCDGSDEYFKKFGVTGNASANGGRVDTATPEYKKLNDKRQQTMQATMVTDFLVLQTSSGDQSVLYYQASSPTTGKYTKGTNNYIEMYDEDGKMLASSGDSYTVTAETKIPTIQLDDDAMWKNNTNSASSWGPDAINIGGYNGKYNSPSTKFNGTGNNSQTRTLFDNDPANTIVRPARPNGKLMIYSNPLNIINSTDNRSYHEGDLQSEVFWTNTLHWSDKTATSFKTSVNPKAPSVYDTEAHFGDTGEDLDGTGTGGTGTSGTGAVDGEGEPLDDLNDYSAGERNFDFSKVNQLKTIWGDSKTGQSTSQYRAILNGYTDKVTDKSYKGYVMDTKYSDNHLIECNGLVIQDPISTVETALVSLEKERDQRYAKIIDASYGESMKNQSKFCPGTASECEFAVLDCKYGEDEVLGEYYFNDGTTVNSVTKITMGTLPSGFSVVGGALKASGNANRITLPTAEHFGQAYQSNIKIKINSDITVDEITKHSDPVSGVLKSRVSQMLYSYDTVGLYISYKGKIGFMTSDGQYIEATNIDIEAGKTYNIEAVFSMYRLDSCTLKVNGQDAIFTNSSKNTIKFNDSAVGANLYIGSMPSVAYGPRCTYDNIVISRVGGGYTHDASCYITQTLHPSGMNKHVHTADCLGEGKEIWSNLDKVTVDGTTYIKVFDHNSTLVGLFNNKEEAKYCLTPGKFSLLSELDEIKASGDYEFMLYYPETGKMNIWSQRNNPLIESNSDTDDGAKKVRGYKQIKNEMSDNYWGGLELSTYSGTLLDGSTSHGDWFYAVGATENWPNTETTIPGENSAISHVQLFIKANKDVINFAKDYTLQTESYTSGGTPSTFNFTGSIASKKLAPGTYTFEAYGAQGGTGALGGYSKGTITFNSATTVYVGVGGQMNTFNGGGTGNHGTGGGATHFATSSGELSTLSSNKGAVLMVAGGGGGSCSGYGGLGGGANMSGATATNGGCGSPGTGGTLTAGGTNSYSNKSTSYAGIVNYDGSFGQGGNGGRNSVGGGGGYYGGGASYEDYRRNDVDDAGGGGGSGYADTSRFTAISGSNGVRSGNGYAVITPILIYNAVVDPVDAKKVTNSTGYEYYKNLYEQGKLTIDDLKEIFGGAYDALFSQRDDYPASITDFNNKNLFSDLYNCDIEIYNGQLYQSVLGTSPSFVYKPANTIDASETGNLIVKLDNNTSAKKAKISWSYDGTTWEDDNYLELVMEPNKVDQTLNFPLYTKVGWSGTVKALKFNIPAEDDKNYGNDIVFKAITFKVSNPEDVHYSTVGKHQYKSKVSGYYLLEAWGASGGDVNSKLTGKGGYTSAVVKLPAGQSIYAYVGGAGKINEGGYNGGGDGLLGGNGGGGMTHFTKSSNDSFKSNAVISTNTISHTSTVGGEASKTYNYTGGIQSVTLDPGKYTIEAWGAQGGSGNAADSNGWSGAMSTGGKGGYVKGSISLKDRTTLYIVVGGAGNGSTVNSYTGGSTSVTGGYNGGGDGSYNTSAPYWTIRDMAGGGGGATHIATKSGLLSSLSGNTDSILMVAGGGGGASSLYGGKSGGSVNSSTTREDCGKNGGTSQIDNSGINAYDYYIDSITEKGLQSKSRNSISRNATAGTFGKGGVGAKGNCYATYANYYTWAGMAGAGGGGGYYGGGGGGAGFIYCEGSIATESTYWGREGGGGSSYTAPNVTSVTKTSGKQEGNGKVVITGETWTESIQTVSLTESSSFDTSALLTVAGGGGSSATEVIEFGYTGDIQSYKLYPGEYILETWGAEGGGRRLSSNSSSGLGGLGGYSKGILKVDRTTDVYVVVGGHGESETSGLANGGYNGGGSGYASSSSEPGNGGGGATHIATSSGVLSGLSGNKESVLIVAGGGGGGGEDPSDAYGHGGGTSGVNGTGSTSNGTQTTAGTNGGFGYGGSTDKGDGGGGGGGYYGGGTKSSTSTGSDTQGGGGGSGYINPVLTDAKTIAGSNKFDSPDGSSETGHKGDGYARITKIKVYGTSGSEFQYTGGVQEVQLQPGTYQLEVWGAQGGNAASDQPGGKGGYSIGEIVISSPTTAYVYTGGHPGYSKNAGYNGGGKGGNYGAGGGGASDIRIGGTALSDRVIVAGGGGGGAVCGSITTGSNSCCGYHRGGYGGGTSGGQGEYSNSWTSGGKGGTQTSGNALGTGGSNTGSGAGGGGGYYGGYAGATSDHYGGGGGSGYIGGVTNGETYAGNQSFSAPDGSTETGHSGNGYARITCLSYNDADDKGSDAYGGGISGGDASVGGKLIAGTGATQTSGYKQGLGQATSVCIKSNGGGGGFYGGTTSNGAAGGGSGYINSSLVDVIQTYTATDGAVYQATTIAGNLEMPDYIGGTQIGNVNNNGNGYAKITFIDEAPGEWPSLGEIFAVSDLLPDDSPIFSCDGEFNYHECDNACHEVEVLNCPEPHHSGNHYQGDPLCYKPCNDDAKHKNIPDFNNTTEFVQGDFINLDWGFQIYFGNEGDFYQSNTHGIGNVTLTRGIGFVNDMDTVKWTRTKQVKMPVNVIYQGNLYQAGQWIPLADKGNYQGEDGAPYDERNWTNYGTEYYESLWGNDINGNGVREYKYDFYCVESNYEQAAAQTGVRVFAINNDEYYSDCGDEDGTNVELNAARFGSWYAAKHTAFNTFVMDVVGRIGNIAVLDTGDYRYSNLFKKKVESNVKVSNEEKFYPSFMNIIQTAYKDGGKAILNSAGDGVELPPQGTLQSGTYRVTVKGSGMSNVRLSVTPSSSWETLYTLTGDAGDSGDIKNVYTETVRNPGDPNGEVHDYNTKIKTKPINLHKGTNNIKLTGDNLLNPDFILSASGVTNMSVYVKDKQQTDTNVTYTLELPYDISDFTITSDYSSDKKPIVSQMDVYWLNTDAKKNISGSDLVSTVSSSDAEKIFNVSITDDASVSIKVLSTGGKAVVESLSYQKMADKDSSWVVEGIVKDVDMSQQNAYFTWVNDIRGLKVDAATHYIDTYDTIEWAQTAICMVNLPIDQSKNNISVLKDEAMLVGYDTYLSIETIGNYYKNNAGFLQVIPEYYALDTKTGNIFPVDAYVYYNSSYYPINIWGLVTGEDRLTWGGTGSGYDINSIYNLSKNLDWNQEASRRMVTSAEKYMTDYLRESLAESIGDTPVYLDTPRGSTYTLGNAQFMQLNGKARTFVGSEVTYGTIMNYSDGTRINEENYRSIADSYEAGYMYEIGSGKNASTTTKMNSGITYNPTGRLPSPSWWQACQRWHFTLGVASSTVFVRAGSIPSRETIDEIQNANGRYVVISTIDIRALGEVWNLRYVQNTPVTVTANDENGQEQVYDIPKTITIGGETHEIPNIINVYQMSSNPEDVSIVGNH